MSTSILNLSSPKLVSAFQFLVANKPTTAVVSDIFTEDLDGDGVQEILFAGRQGNSPISEWSNSTIHIFQAQKSGWTDVTSRWLPDNTIVGTEPNVLFGDFNRDGKTDFFIPADTDMNYLVPSYLFLNNGATFTKQAFDFQTWAHGAYAADINLDGYLDVLNTDYGARTGVGFGSANGFVYKATDYRGLYKSSSICAADFLGDGSISILVADTEGVNSTALFKWSLDGSGNLIFAKLSTLPTPRFELAKWNTYQFSGTDGEKSHDVRIVPFDFSGDGLLDVIEISRPWFTNGQWPEFSEVQFLLNKGNGVFEDVTSSKLVGYNTATSASYQPQLIDVNLDGRTDVFLSASDYTAYDSTTLLLQQANGTFVDVGRAQFTALWSEAIAKVKQVIPTWIYTDHGMTMHLVKGLDQKIQVAGSVAFQNSTGGLSNYVYVSDLAFSSETFNEKLLNTATDDVFDGGVGLDSMVYQKSSDNYSLVRQNATTWQVTDKVGTDGIDTLRNIERIQFPNKSIAYDLDGNAGTTAKILGAVFGKSALSNQSYVGIGLYFLDQGMSYESLAALALGAANVTSNSQVLNLLWTNVVGSQPSNADLAPYIQLLDAGMSQGQLVRLAADSAFNANSIKLVGLTLSGLEFIPV